MTSEVLTSIFASREVIDPHGNRHKLHSEVTPDEGQLIASLIEKNGFNRALEVGCAYGISSLFICGALARQPCPKHTMIDPTQHTYWQGIGVANLERAGYDFFELIEKPSELALPALVEEGRSFQFALIDGFHTFDHVLLDFFYVGRLLEEGGIVVLDDLHLPAVRKAARYLANLPNFRVVGQARQAVYPPSLKRRLFEWPLRALARILPASYPVQVFDESFLRPDVTRGLVSEMVAFEKTGPDERDSHWYAPF